MSSKKSPIEKEWMDLIKNEEKFEISRMKARPQVLKEKLDEYIPEKLQNALDMAFNKEFKFVFEKGSGIIGRTYNKEENEYEYKVKEYALKLKESKKNLRQFSKKAVAVKNANIVVAGFAGIGMGLIGVGIPDIPVFTSMMLRSIYQIAMSFGFDYDDANEQAFILKLIEVPLKDGVDFAEANSELNKLIDEEEKLLISREEQISITSKVLADSMIAMKFLQGIPIVGLVGGLNDFLYMNRISTYAMLKYKRRFLIKNRA
ncbi:MAG: EcsC family protein [Candidatus Metalachnospira sp.]|nr:EcsC family protein [Candidatus Metalachnospira sp.]